MYPSEYLYSRDHEWVHIEGDIATLGITEFAQQELGEVVFVELPERGQVLYAGEELGTIESVKAVAEFYSPFAGEIVEINEAVTDDPELINENPHADGWLVKIKLDAVNQVSNLMNADAYQEYITSGEG